MKTKLQLLIVMLGLTALSAIAQVPGIISHQGKVTVNGTNYTGSGLFKFALVSGDGSITYWSNDGTSSGGAEPAGAVTLPAARGVFSVNLGDTNLTNMTQTIPASVFTNSDVYLRVWFNDGIDGSQLLTPDRRITSVGYAMMAGSYAETDPVFTASPASGITSGQTNNWNAAYGWGNHATRGYLTNYTEADPVFTASAANGILSSDISNWNGKVSTNRTITTAAPLTGGGTLAGNLALSLPVATTSANGYLASTDWTAFNSKVSGVTASIPLASTGGATPNLTIQTASSSQPGALASADWTTFNNKVSATRSISTTAPITGGGTLAGDLMLSLPVATTSANGYLASTDWTTFNNKVSATRNLSTTAPLTGGGTLAGDLTLSLPVATTSANGYLASADWNTFNGKVGGVTVSSPLASTGGTTPNLTIQTASSSQSGVLASADWTTFNGKVSAARNISTTAPLTGGGTLAGDLSLSLPVATTSANGYLGSNDWNTFYGKVGGSGTTNYMPYFKGSSTLTNSPIAVSGTNIGIGITTPTNTFVVAGTLQIADGTQGTNKVLTSDANGKASWVLNVGATSAVIGTLNTNNNTITSTSAQYTGTTITLPPGKWSIQLTILASSSAWSGWIRSGFSSTNNTYVSTPDAIGANSASGFKNASVYGLVTGAIIINNTSGASKTYYYWTGGIDTASGTFSLANFACSSWGENTMVAYPMN